MSKRKFRVYNIANRSELKVWQEMRDEALMTYTAVLDRVSGEWDLHSKLSTRTSKGEHGDYIRSFKDLERLCNFLGVNNPT